MGLWYECKLINQLVSSLEDLQILNADYFLFYFIGVIDSGLCCSKYIFLYVIGYFKMLQDLVIFLYCLLI